LLLKKKIESAFYSIRLVYRVPFTQEEKNYIYEWVGKYLETNDGNISWKLLQYEMEKKFDNLRSRNDLKNTWNAKKRLEARNRAKNRVKIEHLILEDGYEYKNVDRKMEKIIYREINYKKKKNRIHKTIDDDVC